MGDEHTVWKSARPPATVAEVTDDERFTGGRLVRTAADELRALLAQFDS